MKAQASEQDWYHGTAGQFDDFHVDWIGKGDDQLGSGFYFTDNHSTASGYAHRRAAALDLDEGVILTARLTIAKPLPFHARVTDRQIEAILKGAPDYKETLNNFGDVDYDGLPTVLRQAVQVYSGQNTEKDDDTLKMLFCISNDFYRDAPSQFLSVFARVTGYDGLYREVADETHAVVWCPSQISIVERNAVEADHISASRRL